MRVLGLDTSNYTTSAAVFDGKTGHNCGQLLQVRPGELGLRQSDALFQHVKALPGRLAELRQAGISAPILILGRTPAEETERLLALDLTQTVVDAESAGAFSAAARRARASSAPFRLRFI